MKHALGTYLWIRLSTGNILKAIEWHHEHSASVQIGRWKFELPREWYAAESRPDEAYLRRSGLFNGPSMMGITQYSANLWAIGHQQEWLNQAKASANGNGFTPIDSAFDLNGHRGLCAIGGRGSEYKGTCLFVEDQILVSFDGEVDLKEVQRILSSGRATQS